MCIRDRRITQQIEQPFQDIVEKRVYHLHEKNQTNERKNRAGMGRLLLLKYLFRKESGLDVYKRQP